MRFKHGLLIVVLACLAASTWEAAAKFLETFGLLFVAITAVWQQQFVDLFSPAGAKIDLLQDCEKCPVDPAASGHRCIHGRVWSTNPDRHLINARVLFDKIKYDDDPLLSLPVPFQFPWAPGELKRHGITIGKDYEVFDLGQFFRAVAEYGPIKENVPGFPHLRGFRIARHDFQGGFPLEGRNAGKCVTVFLFLRADNLREDHRMIFEVDLAKNTCTLKEFGTAI